MEIKFVWRGRIFSITIGYSSPFHDSMHFIDIIEEFYENRQLVYANYIKGFFREKKDRRRKI